MKDILVRILNDYLMLFPNEEEKQKQLKRFLLSHSSEEIIDWNNFDGHVVASGFVYSKENNKFLVLYHKDMKRYVYPGGHVDIKDTNVLEAAKREVFEETGLKDLEQLKLTNDPLVPIDIDTHLIQYNERLNLPEHFHFDFRYLFVIDKISDVKVDGEELSIYKWIDIDELSKDHKYGMIAGKLKKYLKFKS